MKEGPDIARLAALIGDPARANMLTALMSGKALTATELASEAGITKQTASSHLAKLAEGGLVMDRKQGRHRYFTIADDEVGSLLEAMTGLAAKRGHLRLRTGPKDAALRKARICYDHLAGELAVQMLESCVARGLIEQFGETLTLTGAGRIFFAEFELDMEALSQSRRPLCKSCLDWSARRSHLAGALGTALLNRFLALKWAKRVSGSRVIQFSGRGETLFRQQFIAPAASAKMDDAGAVSRGNGRIRTS